MTTHAPGSRQDNPSFEKPSPARMREINDTIRYTMYSAFKAERPLPQERAGLIEEAQGFLDGLAEWFGSGVFEVDFLDEAARELTRVLRG